MSQERRKTKQSFKKIQDVAAGGPLPHLSVQVPAIELILSRKSAAVVTGMIGLLAVGLGLWYVSTLQSLNGVFGFPLDDAWIHLSFARTLAETGRFALFAGGPATAGSTSPLFTILETIVFFVAKNEFAIAYGLGVAGLVAVAVYTFHFLRQRFAAEAWVAILGSLAVVLEGHVSSVAVSGMETTLVMALTMAALFYHNRRLPLATGVAAGLALWTRPDALILIASLTISEVYRTIALGSPKLRDWKPLRTLLLTAGCFAALYAAMNLVLSGSLLPNTFSAKLAYYKNGDQQFGKELWALLTEKGLWIALAGFAMSLILTIKSLVKRQATDLLAAQIFAIGFVVAYAWKLPYLFQNARYLTPVLPVFIVLGVCGLSIFRTRSKSVGRPASVAIAVALVALVAMQVSALPTSVRDNADRSAYIDAIQVRTAKWIAKNLDKTAVIATHDIGALAFYSGRPVVDIVGLADPEIIPSIGEVRPTLEFMRKRGVTHMAFLRNWFEVTNEKPLFATDSRVGEVMQVMPLSPKTHISSAEQLSIHKYIENAFSQGSTQLAEPAVVEALRREPNNARSHLHAAFLYVNLQKMSEAEREFRTALALYPNDPVGLAWYARFSAMQKQPDTAIVYFERALSESTTDPGVRRAYAQLLVTLGKDSTRAQSLFAEADSLQRIVEADVPALLKRQAQ